MIIYHSYISEDICKHIIDKFDELNKQKIFSYKTDDDIRMFGFEKVLDKDIVKLFFYIDSEASLRFFNKKPIFQSLMVNKTFKPSEKLGLGSGEGWHRDSLIKKQMKTIYYLTKVNNKNGPFTYLEPKLKIFCRFYPMKRRLGKNDENNLKFCSNKISITSNKPGFGFSMITNYPHRGIPVEDGVRYAVTVYSSLYENLYKKSDFIGKEIRP